MKMDEIIRGESREIPKFRNGVRGEVAQHRSKLAERQKEWEAKRSEEVVGQFEMLVRGQ